MKGFGCAERGGAPVPLRMVLYRESANFASHYVKHR